MSTPLVSLIVVTYNQAQWIDQALASVAAQTFGDIEVIVVDDGSTDGTRARILAWREQQTLPVQLLFNEQNVGICISRNRAIRLCRGRYVVALAGDDYYEPDRIARQATFFETLGDTVAAVFSQARVVSPEGREISVWFEQYGRVPEGRLFEQLIRRNFIAAPTVMIRRAAIEAVGGYDESLFFEDYDMWLRLSSRFEFRYLPAIVTNYRWHPTSVSRHARYSACLNESRVRILLKWLGHGNASDDDAVISGAWKFAWSTFAADTRSGRAAIERVCAARPSAWRRLALAGTAVPGSARMVGALHKLALWRRNRARERNAAAVGRLAFP